NFRTCAEVWRNVKSCCCATRFCRCMASEDPRRDCAWALPATANNRTAAAAAVEARCMSSYYVCNDEFGPGFGLRGEAAPTPDELRTRRGEPSRRMAPAATLHCTSHVYRDNYRQGQALSSSLPVAR